MTRDQGLGLPARLPVHLRLVGGGAGRHPHRRGARRGGQQLHRRRDLREGRALRRAHPPPGPADASAAAHRPERLGAVPPIAWDEALDRVAGGFIADAAKHGTEAVWPFYYAGTMGLVQRDGINRLRHVMRYSRQKMTICTSLPEVGWQAGIGAKPRRRSARDGEVRPDRGVGRQSGLHPGQRDDPRIARAEGTRREAGRGRSVSLADRRGGRPASGAAARHRRRAGLRGDARRVPRRLRRPRLHGATTPIARTRLEAHLRVARAGLGGRRSPACRSTQIEEFAALYGHDEAQLHPLRLRLRAQPQRRRRTCTR